MSKVEIFPGPREGPISCALDKGSGETPPELTLDQWESLSDHERLLALHGDREAIAKALKTQPFNLGKLPEQFGALTC